MPLVDAYACPVCRHRLVEAPNERGRETDDVLYYDCPRCGAYGLTQEAVAILPALVGDDPRNMATIAFALRRMEVSQEWPLISADVLQRIIATTPLPSALEQADNLVRWLGDNVSPGELAHLNYVPHGAIVGAHSENGFGFVVRGLIGGGLLEGSLVQSGAAVTLTFSGWQRFQELKVGAPSGRKAFMAMLFGDAVLDRIVREHFVPAVADTGFELRRIDDELRAGLIDDQIRVDIKTAHFLIADLTHENSGAYWEAGYAEGLGKPVIYTCEKSVFQGKSTHFDTNHRLHVLWDEQDVKDTLRRLKATIRATIPDARREDLS